MANSLNLLPGVPEDYVRERLFAAGGKEIESGKFTSPDSSAALAVNAFAWFHSKPATLPLMPALKNAGWPPERIDVEYCARFPWAGGRHPWLDAFIETATHIIGVESKRHGPFRDKKSVSLSEAYDRPVWGKQMGPYEAMRDQLRSRKTSFVHLDAAQLVKHAFGLITESGRKGGKIPILVYLYAEPSCWPAEAIARHRNEINAFARAVDGAAVLFTSLRWQDWLTTWPSTKNVPLATHRKNLIKRFDL